MNLFRDNERLLKLGAAHCRKHSPANLQKTAGRPALARWSV
jgi:hypothetical protein